VEYVVAFLLFIALYAVFVWRKARQHRNAIRKLIRTHLKTLVVKRARGFARDDYGKLVDSGWSKEIAYFYENVIPAAMRTDHSLDDVTDLIEREIRKVPERTFEQWTMAGSNDIASGEDFELFVSQRLEDSGWVVQQTGKSGDQGADLVAERDGVSVAVQCKLYSQPVGNKAVQEALAAQKYYATDRAAVISNAAFTRSAIKLAQSAKVLLLHISDIDGLDGLADAGPGINRTAERTRPQGAR
jgi:restriction system protein